MVLGEQVPGSPSGRANLTDVDAEKEYFGC
jgi:hypothetical protein